MTRIFTAQPAVARPIRIRMVDVPDLWTTLVAAPDFSVPDPQQAWPTAFRDPNDPNRRIQPGQVLFLAPLMIFNTDPNASHRIEIRTVFEDGITVIEQAAVTIPKRETYTHPIPGQRLLKLDPASETGDALQVRASAPDLLQITGAAAQGAIEEHQPE
jgi:hypothetical protein